MLPAAVTWWGPRDHSEFEAGKRGWSHPPRPSLFSTEYPGHMRLDDASEDRDRIEAAVSHAVTAGRLGREAQRLADLAEFHSACARAFIRDWLADEEE